MIRGREQTDESFIMPVARPWVAHRRVITCSIIGKFPRSKDAEVD